VNYKDKLAKTVVATAATVLLSTSMPAMAKTWKVAVGDGGGSAQEALGLKFGELLEQKTDGKYKVNLFLNGQLGSEQDTVNDAAIGTLDFSILASNNLAPFTPTLGMLSLPYLFNNVEEAEKVVTGPIGEELIENTVRDAGVRILGWTFSGYRVIYNSKKPIVKIDDMKDVVVPVPKNEIMMDTYKSWGNNPTPMAWAETFTALQQRVVDGQDTPYITIYAMKFPEVQKYITELSYLFLLEPLIISESLYQEQSDEMKKTLVEAGKEATTYSVKWLAEKEAGIKKDLVEKYGMQIDKLSDEEEWAKRARESVWPKFYDSVGGKDKINQLLESIGRDGV